MEPVIRSTAGRPSEGPRSASSSTESRTRLALMSSHFACGTLGVSEWAISGTTVDGGRVEVRGCDLWTFGPDGTIVRKDSFRKIHDTGPPAADGR